MQDFDEWLEQELDKGYASISSRPAPAEPRYRSLAHTNRRNAMFSPLSFLTSRGIAAVGGALLFGATGAAAATATTGSLNPQVWSQQLSADLSACKAQLGTSGASIGTCIGGLNQNAPASASPSASASANAHGANSSASPSSISKSDDADQHDRSNSDPNHGQIVSEVAHSATPGPGHGLAVSTVARGNTGHDSAATSQASPSPSPSSSASASPSGSPSASASPNSLPGNGHGRGR